MPTGIEAGTATIRLATADGVASHPNTVRQVADGDGSDGEGPLRVETDDGLVLVGAAVADDEGGADDTEGLDPLVGPDVAGPPARQGSLVETFLAAVADDPDSGGLRYVTWRPDAADPLPAVAADAGYDVAPLDAGTAVCYDGLDGPATGLGIAITADRVDATVLAGGVPVAGATLDLRSDWYDIGRSAGTGTEAGLAGAWLARQYETVLGDVATELARTAPALAGPVDVVVGGEAAPETVPADAADALAEQVPFAVGGVTVVEEPAGALARGALAGAESDDGTTPPVPTFAVDRPFVGALADFRAAVDALEGGVERSGADAAASGPATVTGDGAVATTGDGSAAVEQLLARTESELSALDRRGAMTARALSDLVSRLEGAGAGGDHVDSLRADLDALESKLTDGVADAADLADLTDDLAAVEATVEDLAADLDAVSEETATAETVADLESSVADLQQAIADVEADTRTVRGVLAGLDEDVDLDAPDLSAAVETLQADALADDIDALSAELDEQVEAVWSELDRIGDELVDVAAAAEDLPEMESTVTDIRNEVSDLESRAGDLEESVGQLRSDLASLDERSPSAEDLAAVADDVDAVAEDLDAFRTEFTETERVDPETVAAIETDLDGFRQTLISRADRLAEVEETAARLDERIETVYQTSAKSEALTSLQTEVSRIRQTAAGAMERTNEMTETVSDLQAAVESHEEELGMVSTNVDNLAGSSVTRSEMDAAIEKVRDRVDDVAADLRSEVEGVRSLAEDAGGDVEPVEDDQALVVTLQAGALVALGALGSFLALQQGLPLVAGGFLVFSIMPAVLSWLLN
jgi:archaellum component FlaC